MGPAFAEMLQSVLGGAPMSAIFGRLDGGLRVAICTAFITAGSLLVNTAAAQPCRGGSHPCSCACPTCLPALQCGASPTACMDACNSCPEGTCEMAPATSLRLYHNGDYESPVRGEPGDLLLLPGTGFSASTYVVFQPVVDTTNAPTFPPATR
jgi:hypothetical protein